MEARTIGWGLALIVIAVLGFVAMFAIERDTAERDLSLARGTLNDAQSSLDETLGNVERIKVTIGQARAASGTKTEAGAELARVEAAITAAGRQKDELKAAWEKERTAFEGSINAVRTGMKGASFPSVQVGSETLKDATLKSVLGDTVTFTHSAGMSKVPASKLPDDLAAALLLTWKPELKIAEPAADPAVASAKEDAPAVPPQGEPEEPKPASTAPAAENPHLAKRTRLEKERNELLLKIDAALGELRLLQAKLDQIQNDYYVARSRSRIVTVPPGLADAKKAVEAKSAQIEAARQLFNRKTLELKEATAKEAAWTPPEK